MFYRYLIIGLMLMSQVVFSQNKVTNYEYWFDQDFSNKVTTSVSPVNQYHLQLNASTLALNDGIHVIHVRFKDLNGVYSSVNSQFFQKMNLSSIPQRKIVAYEFWFDQNYSGKVSQAISPQVLTHLNLLIPVSSMTYGIHAVHMRYQDDQGTWSSVNSQFFQKIHTETISSKNILGYEYWYDQDYSHKVKSVASSTQNYQLVSNLDVSSLTNGIHTFHIRFQDDYGSWSSTKSDFFQKIKYETPSDKKIVAYEYWIDQQYSSKVYQATSPSKSIETVASFSLSSVPDGIHGIHIRYMDDSGTWSGVLSEFFQKVKAPSMVSKNIVAYEYWIDQDYQNKVYQNTPVQANEHVIAALPFSSISGGVHVLHVRFKDDQGSWSATISQYFQKPSFESSNSNFITGYRYWIDSVYSKKVDVNLPGVTPVHQLSVNLNMAYIPKGIHVLHSQYRDTEQQWSIATTDTFEKESLPIPVIQASSHIFCDSGAVTFNGLSSIDADLYHWDFGDGHSSDDSVAIHHYNQVGTYTVILSVKDTTSGLDSVVSMVTPVIISGPPVFSFGSDQSFCENSSVWLETINGPTYTYIWNTSQTTSSISVSQAGTYWCQVTNEYGCHYSDTIRLTLDLLPVSSFSYSANMLSVNFNNQSTDAVSYYWDFGDGNNSTLATPTHTYLSGGSYLVMLVTENSCGKDTSYTTIDIYNVSVNSVVLNQDIKIFPNPNKGRFDLQVLLNHEEALKVCIYSSDGRLLFDEQYDVTNGLFQKQYRFEDWSDGLYYVMIQLDSTQTVRKIIISK